MIGSDRHRAAEAALLRTIPAPAGGGAWTRLPSNLARLVDAGAADVVPVEEWVQATDRDLDTIRARGDARGNAAARAASAAAVRADDNVTTAALTIGLVLIVLLGAALVIARLIRRPIREVAETARRAADRRSGAEPDATSDPEPVSVRTRDEVGATARALRDLEWAAVDALRSGRPAEPDARAATGRDGDGNERDADAHAEVAEPPRGVADAHQLSAGAEVETLRELVRDAVVDVARFVEVDVVGVPDDVAIVRDARDDVERILAELLAHVARAAAPGAPLRVSARHDGERLVLAILGRGPRRAPGSHGRRRTNARARLAARDRPRPVARVGRSRRARRAVGATISRHDTDHGVTTVTLGLPASILRSSPRTAPGGPGPVTAAPAPTAPVPSDDEAQRLVRFSPVPVMTNQDLLPADGRMPRRRQRREARRPATPTTGASPSSATDDVAFARVDRRAD